MFPAPPWMMRRGVILLGERGELGALYSIFSPILDEVEVDCEDVFWFVDVES